MYLREEPYKLNLPNKKYPFPNQSAPPPSPPQCPLHNTKLKSVQLDTKYVTLVTRHKSICGRKGEKGWGVEGVVGLGEGRRARSKYSLQVWSMINGNSSGMYVLYIQQ